MRMDVMTPADVLGWIAVLFTLVTFSMRTMFPLRVSAICANIFFMGYAQLEGALPILALHAILLPFNTLRLRQIICERRMIKGMDCASNLKPRQADSPLFRPVLAGSDRTETVVVFKLLNGKPLRKFE